MLIVWKNPYCEDNYYKVQPVDSMQPLPISLWELEKNNPKIHIEAQNAPIFWKQSVAEKTMPELS